jgi:hypothetical protein
MDRSTSEGNRTPIFQAAERFVNHLFPGAMAPFECRVLLSASPQNEYSVAPEYSVATPSNAAEKLDDRPVLCQCKTSQAAEILIAQDFTGCGNSDFDKQEASGHDFSRAVKGTK